MVEDRDLRIVGEMSDHLIRHLTLRQLQIFEAIVRLGSYTKAAEELFLTQPTVSMQIKKMSDTIGLPLFEQVERQHRPTAIGAEIYRSCTKIFDTLTNLESSIAEYKGLKRGRLSLGVITTAKYFAPEMLGAFCKEYPDIDISLKVTNRDRVLERIAKGADDLFVLGQTSDDAGLVSIPFAPNPMVVVASKDHPLTRERNISLERLAQEPIILREPGSGIRDSTVRLFQERKLKPRVRMELGSNEAIKHAVVGGLGVSVLSLHTLTLEGAAGPVDILDVEDFPIQRQWYLAYSKERELSLIAKTFLEFVIKEGPEIQRRMDKLMADFDLIHQERWRRLGVSE
ncbi:LysR family transcriptional regulator [Pseudomonadota bacterium]